MKIVNIEISNFRLLENLNDNKINNQRSVNLNNDTTVLVGKNNSGKTSFAYLFDIFLNNKEIKFHDFSVNTYKKFSNLYDSYKLAKESEGDLDNFMIWALNEIPRIQLTMTIKYDQSDNWSYIGELLTSLDESDTLKIVFEYVPKAIDNFFKELEKEFLRSEEKDNIIECVKRIIGDQYIRRIRPWAEDDSVVQIIDKRTINNIISSCFICAQREVDDSNSEKANKLSSVFQKEYMAYNKSNKEIAITEENKVSSKGIKTELEKMNGNIDDKLEGFFKSFVNSFSTFGYPNIEGSEVLLKSNISVTNLFNSIMLFYKNSEYLLPEEYNGLGYSNLIYIISEILNFKTRIEDNATNLNIIFIEEPEAHMHPQLQCTFISNLTNFLMNNGINAQVIITTHSSHMISSVDFESIRYFCRDEKNTTVKDLMKFAPNNTTYVNKNEIIKFLKQYITQVKCDMFFADKIILVEGTSERLLMPLFIEKVDKLNKECIKLLREQYISSLEINGAYMHNFKEFLEFLEIKTLIVTDIDSCEKGKSRDNRVVNKACQITIDKMDEIFTTNQALRQWKPKESRIKYLINKEIYELTDSKIGVTYQRNFYKDDRVKCGRSFEEAFIIDNSNYISENRDMLKSIKNHLKKYRNAEDVFNNSYEIYSFIDRNSKKTQFAFDLMYVNANMWSVPTYILEGLLWLAK